MIEIDVRRDGIDVSGHAGYAPIGEDIVCAGVSTLVQALIVSMDHLTADKFDYDMKEGQVSIKYRNLSARGTLLVDSFSIGVKMIADEYPDNVRVNV